MFCDVLALHTLVLLLASPPQLLHLANASSYLRSSDTSSIETSLTFTGRAAPRALCSFLSVTALTTW